MIKSKCYFKYLVIFFDLLKSSAVYLLVPLKSMPWLPQNKIKVTWFFLKSIKVPVFVSLYLFLYLYGNLSKPTLYPILHSTQSIGNNWIPKEFWNKKNWSDWCGEQQCYLQRFRRLSNGTLCCIWSQFNFNANSLWRISFSSIWQML